MRKGGRFELSICWFSVIVLTAVSQTQDFERKCLKWCIYFLCYWHEHCAVIPNSGLNSFQLPEVVAGWQSWAVTSLQELLELKRRPIQGDITSQATFIQWLLNGRGKAEMKAQSSPLTWDNFEGYSALEPSRNWLRPLLRL